MNPNDDIARYRAIKCAKIAVDEIIKELAEMNNKETFNVSIYGNYWQEVKNELNNML